MKTKNVLKTKNGKHSALFYLVYSLPAIGACLMTALLGYVSYFAINVLGLSSLLVGNLILVSKLFDGASDLVAGFLIDHTNTRFGKARPYDWSYAGFCLSAVLLFCIPKMGTFAMAACLFLTYMLIYTVFQTFSSCASAVYLVRTVEDPQEQVSVNIVSMLLGTIGSVIAAIIIPLYIAQVGHDPAAWRTFACILGIPSAIICSIRFFVIHENQEVIDAAAAVVEKDIKNAHAAVKEEISFRDGVHLLGKNKYVIFIALSLLFVNISTNLTAASPFYFELILGDIAKQSVVNALSVAGPLSIVIFPMLTKRIGIQKTVVGALFLGIIGKLLPLLSLQSIPLLAVGAIFGTVGYMPIYVLSVNLIIQCMDFGEWKFGKRGEGIYSCISGFCSKIGVGAGNWLTGAIMAIGGYSASLAVQSNAAVSSIIALYTWIPAILYLIAFVIMCFYDLEKKLPQIHKDLGREV